MITSNIDAASEPVQAKPFDTGDRVMLNSQLIITMPNRGRTYRFVRKTSLLSSVAKMREISMSPSSKLPGWAFLSWMTKDSPWPNKANDSFPPPPGARRLILTDKVK